MICPVCRKEPTMLYTPEYGKAVVVVPAYLYQISYPGQKGYTPPRCGECLDRMIDKRRANAEKKSGN